MKTDKEIVKFIKDRTMLGECLEQTLTTYQLKELIKEALKQGETLPIDNVSKQRELLKTFCEYIGVHNTCSADGIAEDIETHIKAFNSY